MWKALFFYWFAFLGAPQAAQAQRPPAVYFQELPIYPGARALEEEGVYEIDAPFGTVYTRYQEQLTLEGYTVSELMRTEGSAVWEISRGDQALLLLLDASEGEKVLLQILPVE